MKKAHVIAMHNGKIQARKEALHVILGSALVFLGVIGSFNKLIGLYMTETVCFRAVLTIYTGWQSISDQKYGSTVTSF